MHKRIACVCPVLIDSQKHNIKNISCVHNDYNKKKTSMTLTLIDFVDNLQLIYNRKDFEWQQQTFKNYSKKHNSAQ